MSNSQATTQSSDSFWDRRANKYDKSISDHDQQYEERIANVRAVLQPTDHLLDFGCASGEIALDLVKDVKSIDGIDASQEMIKVAQNKAARSNAQNICFLHAHISDERLEAESYDVVLGLNVLHLVRQRRDTLKRIRSFLKPGGRLLLEIPCLAEFTWWQRIAIRAASSIGLAPYVYPYAFGEAAEELSALGFQILGANTSTQYEPRDFIAAMKPTE